MAQKRPKWHTRLGRESDEQRVLVRCLHIAGLRFFAVPNEGKRSGRTGAGMVARGLSAGAPDLIMISLAPSTGKPVAIELKGKGGALSEKQGAFLASMRGAGWHTIVAWGCDDALDKPGALGYRAPK